MAISEFKYVSGSSLGAIANKVRTHIADGWQPYNPLSWADGKYVQQLIKGSPVGGSAGTVTDIEYQAAPTLGGIIANVTASVAAGNNPYGPTAYVNGMVLQTMVEGTPPGSGGGGGGGEASLVTLTDVNIGFADPLGAGHFIMCYGGNAEDGYLFSNFELSSTVQGLIDAFAPAVADARINALRPKMAYVAPATEDLFSVTQQLNALLIALTGYNYMEPAP